jgi:hypothetical protein
MTITMAVEIIVSRCEGQVTFDASARTCCRKVNGLVLEAIFYLQCTGKTARNATFFQDERERGTSF